MRVSLAVTRKLGSVAFMKDLPKAAQRDFYRQSHSLKPADISKLAVAGAQSASKTETNDWQLGGKYLPVAAWRKKGFEVDESQVAEEDTHQSLGSSVWQGDPAPG